MKTSHGHALVKWELLPAPSTRPASDRYVGLLNKPEDFNCILLASMGLSDEAIKNATGLNIGQIHYRLRKARSVLASDHITRKEFRRGKSPFARMLVNRASRFVGDSLTKTLRALPDAVAYGKKDQIEADGH